jgi:hypothetical protein
MIAKADDLILFFGDGDEFVTSTTLKRADVERRFVPVEWA